MGASEAFQILIQRKNAILKLCILPWKTNKKQQKIKKK